MKSNKDILIQKADKDNCIVIIDRTTYVNKMEKLLSDTSKFEKIEFNSKHKFNQDLRFLIDIETELKSCLDDLLENNYFQKKITHI